MPTRKRKRKNGLDDDSDSGESGWGMMPTPAQLRAEEQGSSVLSLKKKKKKKKKEKNDPAHSQSSISIDKLPSTDFTQLTAIRKKFWTGFPGEDPPSESLKLQRKLIGVICKGLLSECPPPVSTIKDCGLPTSFAEFFKSTSLTVPSVVQKQCWPAALAGLNVLGIAPTGSGKTLAYVLPMVPHILAYAESAALLAPSQPKKTVAPNSLVIVPTRELAIQVTATMKPMKKLFVIRAVAVYGGQDREEQMDGLSIAKSASVGLVVVATPGRLLDLIASRSLSLASVTYLVIDEADRMLAMGFYEQLTAISSQIRPDRQTLLFSATFPGQLREAVSPWCGEVCTIRCNTMDFTRGVESGDPDPVVVPANHSQSIAVDLHSRGEERKRVGGEKEKEIDHDKTLVNDSGDTATEAKTKTNPISSLTVSDTITQSIHVCVPHKRPRLLIKYILRVREQERAEKVRQVSSMLIFCTTIKTAGFVHGFLNSQNVATEILHGQLNQDQRERVLNSFRAGKISVLVSTDVAARGIHIKNLKYVVNYDFPNTLEQYCHRIGRTGRQDASTGGQAYSFFTRNMAPMAPDLLTLLNRCNQVPEPNLVLLAQRVQRGDEIIMEENEEEDGVGIETSE